MKGDPEIIEALNEVLTAELTAINQYFIHAKMCQDWGFLKLAGYVRSESIDEMRHAEKVIDRILLLDGMPNLQRYWPLRVGESVPEQFRCDLAVEVEAIDRLNKGIKLCRDKNDNGTRELLEAILVDEEEHLDWLETQLHLIEQIGEKAYLAEKLDA